MIQDPTARVTCPFRASTFLAETFKVVSEISGDVEKASQRLDRVARETVFVFAPRARMDAVVIHAEHQRYHHVFLPRIAGSWPFAVAQGKVPRHKDEKCGASGIPMAPAACPNFPWEVFTSERVSARILFNAFSKKAC